MSVRSPTWFRRAAWLVAAAILVASNGCNIKLEHDPAETVTVEITGVNDQSDREEIVDTLKGMVEGSSHLMTYSASGGQMTVRLSPVRDVEAFSRKINFGEVTEVDGRKVKVEFVK